MRHLNTRAHPQPANAPIEENGIAPIRSDVGSVTMSNHKKVVENPMTVPRIEAIQKLVHLLWKKMRQMSPKMMPLKREGIRPKRYARNNSNRAAETNPSAA